MSETILADPPLTAALAALPQSDKRLLRALFGLALTALALGVAGGYLTALARAGVFTPEGGEGYRLLTLHGVSVFFYWLYLVQAGLLLAFAAAGNRGRGLALRPAAQLGAALMLAGFLVSLWTIATGTPLLYDGNPELGLEDARTVGQFAAGYLLLSAGLTAAAVSAIATVLAPVRRGEETELSAIGFALFAWAGFLVVGALAAANAFLPNLAWALGLAGFPADHGTNWHILFHNLHYLPLMATVVVWYLLTRHLTGVTSIHGSRLSKLVFAAYLVFVPPTSLYHMFLEPGLPEGVRVAGSLLSLLVSVPTLAALAIILSSLEASVRASTTSTDERRIDWLFRLPWENPAMSAIGWAVVNLLLGLAFALVLIQEKLAPLLSDTFFVPGYFHFFGVGTLTLTFLGALLVILPALNDGRVWQPELLRRLPGMITTGLLLFASGGIAAGLMGVPRRVFDLDYGGQAPAAWLLLMGATGIGATLFAAALTVLLLGVIVSFCLRHPAETPPPTTDFDCSSKGIGLAPAWSAPLLVLLLLVLAGAVTAMSLQRLNTLPLIGGGSGSGHDH